MFILIGETMCPDELKRHSKYNNTSGINRKTAFGNTLCDHIYIFFQYYIEFNIQYFSIIENIAFNTDFNIAIQFNVNIIFTNPTNGLNFLPIVLLIFSDFTCKYGVLCMYYGSLIPRPYFPVSVRA